MIFIKPKIDDLLKIIEALPIDAKTALVEKILDSMHPLQNEIDEEWKKTAEERITELKTGNAQVFPGDEVFKEIKEKYGR